MSLTASSSNATVRSDLAAFFQFDLEMEKLKYISTQVLPVVEVGLQADNPGKVPLEELLFEAETKRTSGSNYNRGGGTFDRFTYATQENGWEEPIDERDKKRYRDLLQLELIAYARALGVVMRSQERRTADLVYNTTTWTGSTLTTAIINEWDDFVNAVPLTDVEAALQKVYDGSGLVANALIVNWKVFRNLRNCEQIIERIQAAGAGDKVKASDITPQMLAACFDLDYVLVGGSSKNTAKEGQAATPGQIWSSEYAMVCKVATSADMKEPCLGRTFHWSEDGSSVGGTVEQYWTDEARSEILRVRHDTDEVIMYPQAGHLLSNVTT